MLTIFVTFNVKSDQREACEQTLQPMLQKMQTEPGVISFEGRWDDEQPNRYVIEEKFENKSAVDAFFSASAYSEMLEKLEPFMVGQVQVTVG